MHPLLCSQPLHRERGKRSARLAFNELCGWPLSLQDDYHLQVKHSGVHLWTQALRKSSEPSCNLSSRHRTNLAVKPGTWSGTTSCVWEVRKFWQHMNTKTVLQQSLGFAIIMITDLNTKYWQLPIQLSSRMRNRDYIDQNIMSTDIAQLP